MKSLPLVFIVSILILFSGCQEKEDLFSPDLIGVWEKTNLDSANGLEAVLSYTFRTDGTYTWHISYREPGAVDNIGYLLVWNGKFSSTESKLTLMPQETFYTTEDAGSPPFSRKEDLVKQEYYPGQVDTYQFNISNGGTGFLLYAQPVVGNGPPSDDIFFTKVK